MKKLDQNELEEFLRKKAEEFKIKDNKIKYIYFADPELLKYLNDKVIEYFTKQQNQNKDEIL